MSLETIYSPEGKAVQVSRLNAIDLIRTAGYSWQTGAAEAAEEVVEEAVAETLADEVTEEEAPAAEAAPVDAKTSDLDDIAAALAGTDAASYLNGFSVDALKTIAEERYGEKLRANVSKERAVERILALEADKIASESH